MCYYVFEFSIIQSKTEPAQDLEQKNENKIFFLVLFCRNSQSFNETLGGMMRQISFFPHRNFDILPNFHIPTFDPRPNPPIRQLNRRTFPRDKTLKPRAFYSYLDGLRRSQTEPTQLNNSAVIQRTGCIQRVLIIANLTAICRTGRADYYDVVGTTVIVCRSRWKNPLIVLSLCRPDYVRDYDRLLL